MRQQQKTTSKVIAFGSKQNKHTHPVKQAIWRRNAWIHSFFIAMIMAISGAFIVRIIGNIQQSKKIEAQIIEAKQEEAAVLDQQKALLQQVELLQQDAYIAKLARSEYYLSKTGEIIFSTPQDVVTRQSHSVQSERLQ